MKRKSAPGSSVTGRRPALGFNDIAPADFTVHTALRQLGDHDPWLEHMPDPQRLPPDLIEEGHTVPIARVQAMHEGKRCARAARDEGSA